MSFPGWAKKSIVTKSVIGAEILALAVLLTARFPFPRQEEPQSAASQASQASQGAGNDFIQWVDFTVTAEAMTAAYRQDVDTFMDEIHLNWIELLACLAAEYGGDFSKYRETDLDNICSRLRAGTSMDEVTKGLKYYPYYLEAYTAVLGGFVGEYEIQVDAGEADAMAPADAVISERQPQPFAQSACLRPDASDVSAATGGSGTPAVPDIPGGSDTPDVSGNPNAPDASDVSDTPNVPDTPDISAAGAPPSSNASPKTWVTKYGLKAFLPIARYFPYQEYDDFGVSRSYGYKRRHLGHDMMGQVGTPIIAVESGRVEAMGWNQYGGWRLGIRSLDKKRYYYYAHLRQNYPYHKSLAPGNLVSAGDVIGYMGRTGYSAKENTNNIDTPHLHFGIQLIFDESQKEGDGEIWINCHEITRFLAMNRSETWRNPETKEYNRIYEIRDPAITDPTVMNPAVMKPTATGAEKKAAKAAARTFGP